MYSPSGIGKAERENEPMGRGIEKLWAIYKNFGPVQNGNNFRVFISFKTFAFGGILFD